MIVYVLYAMIKRQSAHLQLAFEGRRYKTFPMQQPAQPSLKKTPLIERDNYL